MSANCCLLCYEPDHYCVCQQAFDQTWRPNPTTPPAYARYPEPPPSVAWGASVSRGDTPAYEPASLATVVVYDIDAGIECYDEYHALPDGLMAPPPVNRPDWSTLPADVCALIFLRISCYDLLRARLMCRRWRYASQSVALNAFWLIPLRRKGPTVISAQAQHIIGPMRTPCIIKRASVHCQRVAHYRRVHRVSIYAKNDKVPAYTRFASWFGRRDRTHLLTEIRNTGPRLTRYRTRLQARVDQLEHYLADHVGEPIRKRSKKE